MTPSATPAASAAASSSVLDGRFGYVISDGRGGATVRSETSATPVATYMTQGRSWTSLSRTVSPDGRSIAYWASVNDGPVLHVVSAAGGADVAVFTGAKGMYGNAFAWSSDSAGLVVAIDNDCQEICAMQGGTPAQELWTVDIASRASERVASGYYWIPVMWDRIAKLIAAGVTGPGGYLVGYHLVDLARRPATIRGVGFDPSVIGRLEASSDARFVLLSVDIGSSTALSWWPLGEPQKRQDVPIDGAAPQWRPGTTEIWWISGLEPPGCRVPPCDGTAMSSLDVLNSSKRTIRGSFGGSLVGFRADGSAAMTWRRTAPESFVVVDLIRGDTATLPIGREFAGGQFVRLR